jgi:hypothetical protein
MPQYVLVLRDTGFPEGMSADEIQRVIERYGEWMARVKAVTGQKLRDSEGRVMQKNGKGVSVTDGPYAESREVVGGFIMIDAPDYDAAVRMSHDCPHLEFGSIEVREVEVT